MRNPTRRNRNIGTSKQGHGKSNQLVVPFPIHEMKSFFERLGDYQIIRRTINGRTFRFVVESTRKSSFHPCTVEDLEYMLQFIPKDDFGELDLIILRQPKRNEEILKPAWGRLIYLYEFEEDYQPAIILESVDAVRKMKWSKKLSVEDQNEFKRLQEDGHPFIDKKKFFEAFMTVEFSRNTQLYRTLLHEFGHYVHYLEQVIRPLKSLKKELDLLDVKIGDDDTSETNPLFDRWDALDNEYYYRKRDLEELYFSISKSEKEVFAHRYADQLKSILREEGRIPFDRVLTPSFIHQNNLIMSDFNDDF